MDDNGSADPYVKFYLSDLEIKSKWLTKTLTPFFYQKLYLPTIIPSMTKNLKMTIKDYDKYNSNDDIGSVYFSLKDIEDKKYF